MKQIISILFFFSSLYIYSPTYANTLQDLFENRCQSRSYHYIKNFNIQSVYATTINASGSTLPDKRIYFSNGEDSYYQLPNATSLSGNDQRGLYAILISTVYASLTSDGTVDLCYDYRTSPFTVVAMRYDLR
ncbi:hypothetical protein [Microbulbifer spongiae]|uniref:Uncharacterized protein n=1 Tax=Microbulbifer spongiae TaxID=2944933 RepID=A0ABY9E7B5_9GAMM|nr:hypothetical protein [Microbulbifer sp. MI-G]WKD48924.1 hypothetical protein M8T91_13610 [Microbulbifer sp. MI-G]